MTEMLESKEQLLQKIEEMKQRDLEHETNVSKLNQQIIEQKKELLQLNRDLRTVTNCFVLLLYITTKLPK